MYSIKLITESTAKGVVVPLYNFVYNRTLETMPSAYFIITVSLTAPLVVYFGQVFYLLIWWICFPLEKCISFNMMCVLLKKCILFKKNKTVVLFCFLFQQNNDDFLKSSFTYTHTHFLVLALVVQMVLCKLIFRKFQNILINGQKSS